ncbi:hypothetical protein HanPSC8_Chr09g0375701 [Helianthus annuus]|nr:hypothetical protein HanPSC8_Chr09g0375701 [Helianthus annuus]
MVEGVNLRWVFFYSARRKQPAEIDTLSAHPCKRLRQPICFPDLINLKS